MDYLYIGKFVDTHGIKGEVRILLNDFYVYDINSNNLVNRNDLINLLFRENESLYIGNKKEKFKIINYRHHKEYEMLMFEGINNINEIISYKKEKCYVDKKILSAGKIDLFSLIGFNISFKNELFGKIVDYHHNNGNILFEIEKDKKYFIPVNSNFISKIDIESKKVYVENIEGLII